MIELIISIVSNGSWANSFYYDFYQPWLPFYNFLPLIFGVALFALLFGSVFFAVNFSIASLLALAPSYHIYKLLGLEPWGVFLVWGLSTIFILVLIVKFRLWRNHERET